MLNLKKRKIKKKKLITAQDTLPFEKFLKDGIFDLGDDWYSKSIKFSDINYQILNENDRENMFLRYCELLNSFDPSVRLQITVNKVSIDSTEFKKNIVLRKKFDKFDVYRDEYNQILERHIIEGKNDLFKEMYITVSVKSDNEIEARKKLNTILTRTEYTLKKMGSRVKNLEGIDRALVLGEFFNNNNFNNEKAGFKDLIAPNFIEFKHSYFMMEGKYAQVVFLKDIPSYMSDKVFDEIMETHIRMTLSMNISPIEMSEAVRFVKKQISGMEANKIEYQKRASRSGYSSDILPGGLEESLKHAKELLDDMQNKNQKMFLFNMILVHVAVDPNELERNLEHIKSVARKNLCEFGVLKYQQEDGLNSALPYGLNKIEIQRTLTTESLAIFMPFSTQKLQQKNGIYYGISVLNQNMLIFDRNKSKNSSAFIIGTPGSGKSFAAKREIANVFLSTDDDILIIDPEREYEMIAKNFDGEIINISTSSKNYINPFDMSSNYSDIDDPVLLKSEFILSLFEFIIGGSGLTAKEKTIIDRCLKKIYAEYVQDFDKRKIPTLLEFHKLLEQQEEPEAKELALSLEIYAKGSLSIFSHATNINTDNRFIVFDIKDLGNQLKTFGMLVVLDFIWNRITKNREQGKRTWIYMDEIYLLFSNEYSSGFLFKLYKRARKWGGVPTGITQNIEDLLKSEDARSMLSNSDFLLIFNQAPGDQNELAKLLKITETQMSYINNSDEGEGLLLNNGSIIPFEDKFPINTRLYKMMTTKISEFESFNKDPYE